jgi:hypothetical protein
MMTKKAAKSKRISRNTPNERLSLAPLDFETAVAAAMATGKPPIKKNRPQKKKSKRK